MLALSSLGGVLFNRLSMGGLDKPVAVTGITNTSTRSNITSFLGFLTCLDVDLKILGLLPVPMLSKKRLLFCLVR